MLDIGAYLSKNGARMYHYDSKISNTFLGRAMRETPSLNPTPMGALLVPLQLHKILDLPPGPSNCMFC